MISAVTARYWRLQRIIFLAPPPPPHPITKKLCNLCCSFILLNLMYGRLKNVETSHILEKIKKIYTAFSLKCAHFIIFIFVYKTKH